MIKNIIASVVTSLVVLVLGLAVVLPQSNPSLLGGRIETVLNQFSGGIQVGTTGSNVAKIIDGTVNCTGTSTIAATAVASYNCAVTGAVSGDKVFVSLPSGTVSPFITLVNSYASTTSGYIVVTLRNASTTASVAPTGATTSVPYLIVR